jgi:signal transduction histidine kinase
MDDDHAPAGHRRRAASPRTAAAGVSAPAFRSTLRLVRSHTGARGAALAALAGLALAGTGFADEPKARPRRVLSIHTLEPGVPVNAVFTAGLRAALPLGSEVALFSEHLDRIRFPDAAYVEEFRAWLRTKYARAPPDVIVAVGAVAVQFLADPANTPFPGTPVVFGMVPAGTLELDRLPPTFTGVTEQFAVRENLALALTLFPGTEHVALVGGAAAQERSRNELLRREVGAARGRLEVIPLFGLSMSDLQARLRQLPPRTVVIVGSFLEDGAGRQWAGPQSIPAMVSASSAPLFTTVANVLELGTIGGVATDYEESGQVVAGLVQRVLAGERPETIPVRRLPGRTLLDARQLDRWHVPDALVPAEAEVRFREPSLWQRYARQMLFVSFALVLQTVLIVGLLFERRRRKTAERRAREELALIAHLNRIGAIGELAGSFAHELNTPLGAVLNNAQAARRFLDRGPERTADVRACLDDIVGDTQRAGEVVSRMRTAMRREDMRQERMDVAAVVRDAVRLVEGAARTRDVAISTGVDPDLPPVYGDGVQLVQVVLNLILNAIEALGGMPLDRRRVSVGAVRSGSGVEIRVADTGPGIDPADAGKVFEPFFTTKSGGLGLGLAISRSIVEAHSGVIRVLAAPEGGAEFRVFLPAARRGDRPAHAANQGTAGT